MEANYYKNFFPMETARPGQLESIEKIMTAFSEGRKFYVLEGATGTGKSAIGYTILQLMQPGYYLAPQKILQDQLVADFGETGKSRRDELVAMVDLKGRNAYECLWFKHHGDRQFDGDKPRNCAEEAECTSRGLGMMEECQDFCPYYLRKNKALASNLTLLNFHSFIYQVAIAKFLPKRKVLVIDEAHNLESALLSIISMTLRSSYVLHTWGLMLPRLSTPQEYQQWVVNSKSIDKLRLAVEAARANRDNPKKIERMENILWQMEYFVKADMNGWVVEISEGVSHKTGPFMDVKLQPVVVGPYAEEFFFKFADHVLLMSGTILDLKSFLRGIDVKLDYKHQFSVVKNPFPVKNRRVVKEYAYPEAFSFKNQKQSWPFMVKKVIDICNRHAGQRGIIHAHSHAMARAVYDGLRGHPLLGKRILFQGEKDSEAAKIDDAFDFEGDREALLKEHMKREDSIILAPAMHEGLDLKDELGRFQILTKVPWPNLKAPLIVRRDSLHPGYSQWLTALKFIQSLGRVVRHMDDWGITYLIDAGFDSFIENNRSILPAVLYEALNFEKAQSGGIEIV